MKLEDAIQLNEVATAKMNPLEEIRVARIEMEMVRKHLDPNDHKAQRALQGTYTLFDEIEAAIQALPGSPDEMRLETDVGAEHIRWLVFRDERVFKVEMVDHHPHVVGVWVRRPT
jgi:hypothetical protein